jgi:two-component system, cell cycle response regulator
VTLRARLALAFGVLLLGPAAALVTVLARLGLAPTALVVGLAAVPVAGVLSWVAAGSVTRPLRQLAAAVERAGEGDLTVRCRLGGDDEAGRLGDSIDRLIAASQRSQLLSVTDPLTGLGNVRHLGDTLRLEVDRASRFGRTLGVLMLDLDHFKSVNDRYGHRAGDAVLVEFADRLRGVVRGVDRAFRQGGEEFVVLLPETDVPGSLTAAGRIRNAVRGRDFVVRVARPAGAPGDGAAAGPPAEVRIAVTVSIGVAVFPRHALSAGQILDAADAALYGAKSTGRDTYVLAGVGQLAPDPQRPGPPYPAELAYRSGAPPPGPFRPVPDVRRPAGAAHRSGEAAHRPAETGGASGGTTSPRTAHGG